MNVQVIGSLFAVALKHVNFHARLPRRGTRSPITDVALIDLRRPQKQQRADTATLRLPGEDAVERVARLQRKRSATGQTLIRPSAKAVNGAKPATN